MLKHMLEHGLPDAVPHCLSVIRNVFEAEIESIPKEPELPDVSPERGAVSCSSAAVYQAGDALPQAVWHMVRARG